MKKFIYQITMMMAVAFCLAACDDKNDSNYEAGTPTPAGSMQVYFDASNASDFITAPGESSPIEITVSRKDTVNAAEVPIVCLHAASGLTIPSTVKFEPKQKTATLTIGLGTLEENKKYDFSLAIGEEYADHYAILKGSSTYSGYVMEASWDTYVQNVTMTWTVGGSTQTWNQTIERLGTTNRYRIRNFVDSGLDMIFTVGGDAVGMSGYQKIEPYTNYEDWVDGDVNCFVLYDTANDREPEWTVGDKTVNSLYIMRSYGSDTYSYISFEKGYGMFGTYYTSYSDGTSDSYNYIEMEFNPVDE